MIKILDFTAADVDKVYDMIQGLAQAENLIDGFKLKREDLLLLVGDPTIKLLVAKYFDEVVAYSIYFENYSTFLGKKGIYIEDIFVQEKYRNLGIAKSFFNHYCSIALERDYHRIDFQCLKDNYGALKVYEKIGAKMLPDWVFLRIESDKIISLGRNDDSKKE